MSCWPLRKRKLSDLIEHPFIFDQTLEWMQWPFPQEEGGALSQTVKNASSEYAVSAWMPWCSTFLVDPAAITVWAHWEPVLAAAEIYRVLLWRGFDVAPLWALTPCYWLLLCLWLLHTHTPHTHTPHTHTTHTTLIHIHHTHPQTHTTHTTPHIPHTHIYTTHIHTDIPHTHTYHTHKYHTHTPYQVHFMLLVCTCMYHLELDDLSGSLTPW